MAIINTRNSRSFKNPPNLVTYGAPILDEAKLQALFSQIGGLETQVRTEQTAIGISSARNALAAKIAPKQAEVANIVNNLIIRSQNAAALASLGPRYTNTGNTLTPDIAGANRDIRAAGVMFSDLLLKAGFSPATVDGARLAFDTMEKQIVYSTGGPTIARASTSNDAGAGSAYAVGSTVNVIMPKPFPNPQSTATARTVFVALMDLFKAVTPSDMFELMYPALPNPFAADYTAQFDAHIASTYTAV